jgi:hypothetical protein
LVRSAGNPWGRLMRALNTTLSLKVGGPSASICCRMFENQPSAPMSALQVATTCGSCCCWGLLLASAPLLLLLLLLRSSIVPSGCSL